MRRTLTDKGIVALKPRAARYAFPDPELRGHYVRIQPSGAKSFCTVTRSPSGKQLWTTLGNAELMTVDEAREKAREIIKRVRAGLPVVERKGETFGTVADNWIQRHVITKGLISRPEIERLLAKHVLPAWRDREFISLRRSDVAALLDHLEDNHGPREADYSLAVVRGIMHWFATRTDDYNPPVVRGMRRQSAGAQARARILDDDELRAVWLASASVGTLGGIVRLCLLTAQRSRKVAAMRWADISDAGEWTIARAPREKGTAGSLVLPELALAAIRSQPQLVS